MIRKKNNKTLTLQQRNRIQSIQTKKAEKRALQKEALFQELSNHSLSEEREGLVIAHFGLNVEVEDHEGGRFRCAVRKSSTEEPVCGDRVIWQASGNDQQGVIVDILKRSSVLQRPVSYQRVQTIAANVNRICIITDASNLNFGFLDRYLAAAESQHIEPMIIINKMDLALDPKNVMILHTPYQKMNYPIIPTSSLLKNGLDLLLQALKGRISVFVGQSGVGKTSLAAHWIQSPSLKIGHINQETGKGRHTTTVASLYHLPTGGSLIDSPGIREFGLYGVKAERVGHYFRDILPFLGQCHFSNCKHTNEPRCAVQHAVNTHQIHPTRLLSLKRIQESILQEKPF